MDMCIYLISNIWLFYSPNNVFLCTKKRQHGAVRLTKNYIIMISFTKKGQSLEFQIGKIEGSKVILRETSTAEELVVSMYQLKHFGHLESGMIIHAYCHADYSGEDRFYIYPDRNYSEPVDKIIDENVRLNVLEKILEFDQPTLEKIASVISKGNINPEELSAAAGVSTWRPESSTLEYKSGYNPDAISEAIVALFNSFGGDIFVGVSDSLKAVGLEANGLTEDQMRRGIINHLRQTTSGTMLFDRIQIRFETVQGHMIAHIIVPEHQDGEIAYYRNSLVVRVDNTSHHLSGENHTQWILQRFKSTYIQTNKPLAV